MTKQAVDFQIENETFLNDHHDEIQAQMRKDGVIKLYGNSLDDFYQNHQTDISERQAFEAANPDMPLPASMKVAKYEYAESLAEDPDTPEAEGASYAKADDQVVNMDDVMAVYDKYLNPAGEPMDATPVRPIKLGYDRHGEARAHEWEATRHGGENGYGDSKEAHDHPIAEMPKDVHDEVKRLWDLEESDMRTVEPKGDPVKDASKFVNFDFTGLGDDPDLKK